MIVWKKIAKESLWYIDCEGQIERQIESIRLKEEACGDMESHFLPFLLSEKMGYEPTDRRTDITSYRDDIKIFSSINQI